MTLALIYPWISFSEAYPNCEDGEVGLMKQFLQVSCSCKMGKDI